MKTLLLSVLFALPAFAADPSAGRKPPTLELTLEPGKVHEECMRLQKGDARRFEWSSDVAVDFNIHYHKGDDVLYPFKANNRKGAKARFAAAEAHEYCWMWTARKAAARVSATIR
jgi:hypothetical protein